MKKLLREWKEYTSKLNEQEGNMELGELQDEVAQRELEDQEFTQSLTQSDQQLAGLRSDIGQGMTQLAGVSDLPQTEAIPTATTEPTTGTTPTSTLGTPNTPPAPASQSPLLASLKKAFGLARKPGVKAQDIFKAFGSMAPKRKDGG